MISSYVLLIYLSNGKEQETVFDWWWFLKEESLDTLFPDDIFSSLIFGYIVMNPNRIAELGFLVIKEYL